MKEYVRIAVCDDVTDERRNTINIVEKYIDSHEHVVKVDEYSSGESLIEALENGNGSGDTDIEPLRYDVVILDIFMDKMNGIETAKQLNEKNPGGQIIFCSTSNEFAAESYDVAAFRYLTKPVSEEKLFQTLDIYFHAHKAMWMLTYKQNRMDESIYVSDLLWIEAGDHKSILHTKNGDIVTSSLLKQLSEQLIGMDFVKPIRYALVSLAAVSKVPTDVLILCDGTQVPISRGSRQEIKKAFTDYKMKILLRKGGIG